MDTLPGELIVLIGGKRLDVIDALRAVCGGFRRLLAVPPLLLDGAEVKGELTTDGIAAACLRIENSGTTKDKNNKVLFTLSRGDREVRGRVVTWNSLVWDMSVRWTIFEGSSTQSVLRSHRHDFIITVEMTRGSVVGGTYTGLRFSMIPTGTVFKDGCIVKTCIADDPVNNVVFRAASHNIFPLKASTLLKLSMEDTNDVFMAALVHTSRVHEFAALGWCLTGKLPTWL